MSQVAISPSTRATSNACRSSRCPGRRDHTHALVSASSVKRCDLRPTHLLQGIGRQVSEVASREPYPPCTCDDIAKRLMDRVRRATGAQLMRRLLDEVQIEIDIGALDHGDSIHPTWSYRYTSGIRRPAQADTRAPSSSPPHALRLLRLWPRLLDDFARFWEIEDTPASARSCSPSSSNRIWQAGGVIVAVKPARRSRATSRRRMRRGATSGSDGGQTQFGTTSRFADERRRGSQQGLCS